MKNIRITMIMFSILFSVLFSSNVIAECTSWGCYEYVETLYTNIGGVVYVGTTGDETKSNCRPVSDVYFQFNVSDPGGAAIYSTLLAAQMADKRVSIRIRESSSGEIGYVTLKKQ